jgi:hypothetical protein
VPDYLNTEWTGSPLLVARSDRLNLPGQWTTFLFDHDISDTANQHTSTDQASVGVGPRYCHGRLDYQLIGGNLGEEIQIRTYEVNTSGARVETSKPHEFYLSAREIPTDPDTGEPLYPKSTHQWAPIVANINSGHRLRIEITRWDPDGPDLFIAEAQFTPNYF